MSKDYTLENRLQFALEEAQNLRSRIKMLEDRERRNFAAMAMQAIIPITDREGHAMNGDNPYEIIARNSVRATDALIKELDKDETPS